MEVGVVQIAVERQVAVRGMQLVELHCWHFASALGGHGHSGAPEPMGRPQLLPIFPKSMKGRVPEDRSLSDTENDVVTSTNTESDSGSAPWRLELSR